MRMTMSWGIAALLALAGIGCGGASDAKLGEGASAPSLAPQVPPPRPDLPSPSQQQPVAEPAPQVQAAGASWRITSKGVGPLKLGAAVPEPATGYQASYATSFYADAQPLEGFQLTDPPALAVVSGGPFKTWGYDHPGDEAPAAIRQRAIALARTGKLPIEMIVITDPRPKTEQGVGAGDSYASYAQANPATAELQRFPGLWEEPSCVATQDTIWYFFDRCDVPDQAKLLRIVVRADDGGSEKGEARRKGDSGRKSEGRRGESKRKREVQPD
jgi:hypothetical protein